MSAGLDIGSEMFVRCSPARVRWVQSESEHASRSAHRVSPVYPCRCEDSRRTCRVYGSSCSATCTLGSSADATSSAG